MRVPETPHPCQHFSSPSILNCCSGSFNLHINFRIGLLMSTKCWDFDWNCVESKDYYLTLIMHLGKEESKTIFKKFWTWVTPSNGQVLKLFVLVHSGCYNKITIDYVA